MDLNIISPNYSIYLQEQRFDKIALDLCKAILSIVPFNEKASLNMILIGVCPSQISYSGYLGWHLNLNFKNYIDENYISLLDIKNKLNDPTIENKLKSFFDMSQEYLIKPIMKILLEKSDSMYQSEMNRYLNLDKLEITPNRKGYITQELYMRLVYQELMQKNKKNRLTYYKTISQDVYNPPEFIKPKPQYSILHTRCLKQLQSIIDKKKGKDIYKIECEYPYKLANYKNPARADILIKKNGENYGIIEADGRQHYEYIPHLHNLKNERNDNQKGYQHFIKLQAKDSLKDDTAKILCHGKNCLRIKYDMKDKDINHQIMEWL